MACDKGCRGGHLLVQGKWVRCSCLEKEVHKRALGVFNHPHPKMDTALIGLRDKSIIIEGPLASIRAHMAGVILTSQRESKTFASTDAYRLVEIFLDKDNEFKGSQDIAQFDLYTMLLGFAEVKNQRLPDLICQILGRRELDQKPTWVILGMPLGQVAARFTTDVYDYIKNFQKVQIR